MSWASSTCALPSRLRAWRAKIEDQCGAIDHLHAEAFLQRPELSGRELLVEDHGVRAAAMNLCVHLLELAPPDVGGGVRLLTALHDASDRFGAGGIGERVEPSRSPSSIPGPTPTRTAFSRTAGRHVADSGDSSTWRSTGRRVRLVGLEDRLIAAGLPHRRAEVAEHLVQPHLVVGRLRPVTDDKTARKPEVARRKLPRSVPGITTAPEGTRPRCSIVSEPVTSITGVFPVSTTPAPSTAFAPTRTLDHDAPRADERAVLDHDRRGLERFEHSPIPTPPARCTPAPIWAHEPTVAHVSTIVSGPTHAPMFT